jgi:hypothetical protein
VTLALEQERGADSNAFQMVFIAFLAAEIQSKQGFELASIANSKP